jgi:hypothetical protein
MVGMSQLGAKRLVPPVDDDQQRFVLPFGFVVKEAEDDGVVVVRRRRDVDRKLRSRLAFAGWHAGTIWTDRVVRRATYI